MRGGATSEAGVGPWDAGPQTGGVPSSIPGCEGTTADEIRLRRLTLIDINRSLDDVLGAGEAISGTWPAHRLGPRAVMTEAEAREVVRVARARARAFVDGVNFECEIRSMGCFERWVGGLGELLWRRPLLVQEHYGLRAVFDAQDSGDSQERRFAAVVEAMIESPYFLFRVELGDGSGNFTSFEIASRLAFFLWRSGPDPALLEAAGAGLLITPDGIEQEALRMLADPRAVFGLSELTREWLGLVDFEAYAQEVDLSDARPSMEEQTRRFLSDLYSGTEPTLDRLLLETKQPLDNTLANYYETGHSILIASFLDVELDPARFSGILTHGTLLVTTPSLAHRGSLVQRALLCRDVPPEPPDVTPNRTFDRTSRELSSSLLGEPACAGCHVQLDPIGFGLAGFDDVARPQAQPTDGYFLELDFQSDVSFVGPRGLGELVVSSSGVNTCVARQWLEYALDRDASAPPLEIGPGGIPPTPPPPSAVDCLGAAFRDDAHHLPRLAVAIAKSAPFRRVNVGLSGLSASSGAPTPLRHALDQAQVLRSVYFDNGVEDLQAYADALLVLIEEESSGGAGGAGGAAP